MFVMLMLEEALAQVKTHLDVESMQFIITQGNREILTAHLDNEGDCARVEEYFHRLVPTLRAAPRLVRSRSGHFMDKPDNVLSLINIATVSSLAEQWGVEINPLRFRANIYIDGAQPWEEFEWIGGTLRIGGAAFRVDRRNGRCGATNVNPDTGRRDLDIPGSLRAAFGHKDLGIYLVTAEGGAVEAGDSRRGAPDRRVHRSRHRRTTGGERPPPLHVPRLLLHLRRGQRLAAAEHSGGHELRRHPVGLALPGLRNREDDVPAVCRQPGQYALRTRA
jgi:MOSC domain